MNYCELDNEKISVSKLFNKYENYEAQSNQAAGVFLRWLWNLLHP